MVFHLLQPIGGGTLPFHDLARGPELAGAVGSPGNVLSLGWDLLERASRLDGIDPPPSVAQRHSIHAAAASELTPGGPALHRNRSCGRCAITFRASDQPVCGDRTAADVAAVEVIVLLRSTMFGAIWPFAALI